MPTELFRVNRFLAEGATALSTAALFGRTLVGVDRSGVGLEIVSVLDTLGPRDVRRNVALGTTLTFGAPGNPGGEDIEILYTRVT